MNLDNSQNPSFSSVGPPPALVLAVTGHRRIADPTAVALSIRSVLSDLSTSAGQLVLLSPLAEGADRLAAHEILRLSQGVLKAVIPYPPAEYEKDFATAESCVEFRDLLDRSASVENLPLAVPRSEVYRAVGCQIVDACDILLAVWDGAPVRGTGGTAEVVAYARACEKPLVIIDSRAPDRVTRERLKS